MSFPVMYACLPIPVGQPCSAANGSLLPHNGRLPGRDLLTWTQGGLELNALVGIDVGGREGGRGMRQAGRRAAGAS